MHEVLIWSLDATGKPGRDTRAHQARCENCTWKGKVHKIGPGLTPMGTTMAAQTDKRAHEMRSA